MEIYTTLLCEILIGNNLNFIQFGSDGSLITRCTTGTMKWWWGTGGHLCHARWRSRGSSRGWTIGIREYILASTALQVEPVMSEPASVFDVTKIGFTILLLMVVHQTLSGIFWTLFSLIGPLLGIVWCEKCLIRFSVLPSRPIWQIWFLWHMCFVNWVFEHYGS